MNKVWCQALRTRITEPRRRASWQWPRFPYAPPTGGRAVGPPLAPSSLVPTVDHGWARPARREPSRTLAPGATHPLPALGVRGPMPRRETLPRGRLRTDVWRGMQSGAPSSQPLRSTLQCQPQLT
jgi:hypothetical protein